MIAELGQEKQTNVVTAAFGPPSAIDRVIGKRLARKIDLLLMPALDIYYKHSPLFITLLTPH